jgi:hypothetical protein
LSFIHVNSLVSLRLAAACLDCLLFIAARFVPVIDPRKVLLLFVDCFDTFDSQIEAVRRVSWVLHLPLLLPDLLELRLTGLNVRQGVSPILSHTLPYPYLLVEPWNTVWLLVINHTFDSPVLHFDLLARNLSNSIELLGLVDLGNNRGGAYQWNFVEVGGLAAQVLVEKLLLLTQERNWRDFRALVLKILVDLLDFEHGIIIYLIRVHLRLFRAFDSFFDYNMNLINDALATLDVSILPIVSE